MSSKAIEAFVCAAEEGRLADVQRLLREERGLKISDCLGLFGTTALEAAIQFSQVPVVQWLIQQDPDSDPIMLCKAYKDLAADWTSDRQFIVRLLHEHRASSFEPFHDPEVLNKAVEEGMEDVVKLLIKRGAHVDAAQSEDKMTPLVTALYFSQDSIVRILLNAGALVDQRASISLLEDATPLMFAAYRDRELSVRLLLERGASIHDVDAEGKTVLMYAVGFGNAHAVHLVLNAGSLVNAQSHSGETALMRAARLRNEVAVRVLLEYGASVALVDNKNQTALMHAALLYQCVAIMRVLLNAGSPVNTQSDTGDSALMLLVQPYDYVNDQELDQSDAIRLLLEHGATIDQVNNQGWTALMLAASKGRHHVAVRLLKHGALVDIQTDTGETALTLAQKEDHIKVVNVLRAYSECAVNPRGYASTGTTDGWISLLHAATIGDNATVLYLLQANMPIDRQTSTGETVLMRAVWNQQVQVVRRLIKYGANLDLLDNNKRSALLKAAHVGNAEIARLLVEAGAAVDASEKDGESALMRAASKGNTDVVKVLIEHGASIDSKISNWWERRTNRWTALMFAASCGFGSVVKLLIEAGASVNRIESFNCDSPLICAAKNGHEDVVRMLIKNGAQVNSMGEANRTALQYAIRNCHENIARILIECGAKLDQNKDKWNTALMDAAENGRDYFVSMLLEHGAFVDVCNSEGKTALMDAASSGHEECLHLLLQGGASVDIVDSYKNTALIRAASRGQEACVRLLLQWGSYNAQNGQDAMICAAEDGHEACVLVLLQAGVTVNALSESGDTALMRASRNGKNGAVRILLSQGAFTELKDSEHRTSLMLAAEKGHDHIVRQLIQANALVNAKGFDGQSVLSLASKWNRSIVVDMLIVNGARVDSVDDKGRTPLMLAAENGCVEVVRVLLTYGADIDAVDHEYSTAIMQAVLKGQVEIVGLLRDHGALLDIRNKHGLTAFMLAADFGDNSLMRELLLDKSALMDSIAYLQAGMAQHDEEVNQQAQLTQCHELTALKFDLIQLCNGMLEASEMCHRVHERLFIVEKQLKCLNKVAQRGPKKAFMEILQPFQIFLMKYARKPTVTHLVSSAHIVETCQRTHEKLNQFVLDHRLACDSCDWDKQFNKDAQSYKLRIDDSVRMDWKAIFDELQETEAQQEVMVLLLFECHNRVSKYTEKEMDLMHRTFRHISSFSKLGISSVPKWFVPPQDVDIMPEFARGSYGSVHIGRWNGAEVVVKSTFLLNAQSRAMFLQEADIWYKLLHPNVIQLYRACHVGNPFFVCEYAANGMLSDFLFKNEDPAKMWEKLFEAACGLLYLHEEHKVVHGDLKCNNILVGGTRSSGDGPAKLMDFGLSFKVTPDGDDSIHDDVGAIQWKAPEVIEGRTRGSLASDVYSFGMCILEAVKGGLPWGNYPDATVKYKLLKGKQLPSRPTKVNDAQWGLISRMCTWETSDRPKMKEVVDILQEFAQGSAVGA